jgi:hypothetical protein
MELLRRGFLRTGCRKLVGEFLELRGGERERRRCSLLHGKTELGHAMGCGHVPVPVFDAQQATQVFFDVSARLRFYEE